MKSSQFFGSYSISPELEKFLQSQKTVIPFAGGVNGDAGPLKMDMSDLLTDEREEIMNDEDISDEPSSNIRRTSARAATNEKVEVRKRWIALLGKIGSFLDFFSIVVVSFLGIISFFLCFLFFFSFVFPVGGTRTRTSFKEAQTSLEEALSLSIPFSIALCSTGSAAQTSNDLSAVENARVSLHDFIKVLSPGFFFEKTLK
jgi:hypothetical protein